MNKLPTYFTLISFYLFTSFSLVAQVDCSDPLVLCGESPFTITPSSSVGAADDLGDVCSTFTIDESNPVWIELNVESEGELIFTITPSEDNIDIDFFVYKVENNCDDKTIIRCMLSGETANVDSSPCFGPTGLAFGETDLDEMPGCENGSNNFLAPLVAEAGEKYMILINEFTLGGEDYEIEFGGTASIECITSSLADISPEAPRMIVLSNISETGLFDVAFNVPSNKTNYKVYNSMGGLVYQKSINSNFDVIDLSTQTAGFYFLVVESNAYISTERLVLVN